MSSSSKYDGEAFEALSTLRCIVRNFESMSSVQVINFNGTTSAHEMLLEVCTKESNFSSFWSESKLCPQSLSCLDIGLYKPTKMELVVAGKIETFLEKCLTFLIVLSMYLNACIRLV